MPNLHYASFPLLHTSRLTLRQLSLEDKEEVFALRSNPAVNKYIDREPSKSIDDVIKFINSVNQGIEQKDLIYWAITLTASNIFIGGIGLFRFSDDKKKCEVGYELLPEYQGKGIMDEAIKPVLNYAFGATQLQTIEGITHKDNQASIKLLIKHNFINSNESAEDNADFIIYRLANQLAVRK